MLIKASFNTRALKAAPRLKTFWPDSGYILQECGVDQLTRVDVTACGAPPSERGYAPVQRACERSVEFAVCYRCCWCGYLALVV